MLTPHSHCHSPTLALVNSSAHSHVLLSAEPSAQRACELASHSPPMDAQHIACPSPSSLEAWCIFSAGDCKFASEQLTGREAGPPPRSCCRQTASRLGNSQLLALEVLDEFGIGCARISTEPLHFASEKRFGQPRSFVCRATVTRQASSQRHVKQSPRRLQGASDGIDSVNFVSLLRGCVNLSDGQHVHAFAIRAGLARVTFVANLLISMYGKLGSVEDARSVFDDMQKRNLVSWNSMLSLYSQQGHDKEALELFQLMEKAGMEPDRITFLGVLQACASLTAIPKGELVHASIVDAGYDSDVPVATALVDMYGKRGALEDAQAVFDSMNQRNVISWTVMIAAYAQLGHGMKALQLFREMQQQGLNPNRISLNTVLQACAMPADLEGGKQIHVFIVDGGSEADEFVGTSLVDMYGKCGTLEAARVAFHKMHCRNVITWTAMITVCSQQGHCVEAIQLFRQMQQEGVEPNEFTFSSALSACATLSALAEGESIHKSVLKQGFESEVLATALVNMYGKCGSLNCARSVFDGMKERSVISWTAMICSYTQQGYAKEALQLFGQMQEQGVKPNQVTYISVLSACAILGALPEGEAVHSCVMEDGFELDVVMGTALISMYGKCAALEKAQSVFETIEERNVVCWNSMIAAYGHHGHGKEALKFFWQMLQEGVKPDDATFINILSACSHAGLVDEGWGCFDCMTDYGIEPTKEHYSCMVDLYGRSGRLEEAEALIYKMPFQPNVSMWRTLLGACRMHGDVIRGIRAAEHLLDLAPEVPAPYILLSNLYAANGRMEDVEKVRKAMAERGVKEERAFSLIEVENSVHEFCVGDMSHPKRDAIYLELESLNGQMKKLGYVPDTKLVWQDVEEVQKEHMLAHHSEKLAIAFGVISTPTGTPLRITKKNLRICSDCHNAAKFISKVVERELFLRDTTSYHHIKHGVCSCGDYW